jgi:hypothetical protein
MSGRSSIDSLRRLAPVSDSDAAGVFSVMGREDLLVELTQLPFGRGASRRPASTGRRRLVIAFAAVAVVATATAATWAIVSSGPARETTSIQCLIGKSDAIIPSTSGDPAHDCAVDYSREFGTTAPPLVAYDNSHGGVTVLPRSAAPPAGWRTIHAQDVALIELQDSLDDVINGLNSSCLDPTSATKVAQAKLDQFGFTGWTVSVRDQSSADTPGTCTNVDIVDPATQSVTLAAGGGLTAGGTSLKLAEKLRPVTRRCESLPAAVASVRAAASSLGLSEPARTYDLNAVTDNSLHCASIYETVGGTIFLTVRGPTG